MEWFEKEQAYTDRCRTKGIPADVWKYVPKKYSDAVYDAHADEDGYWLYLDEGYRAYDHAEDCGVIHEYTVADLKEAIKTIEHNDAWTWDANEYHAEDGVWLG